MWQKVGNWAAVALVGGFSLLWTGVVLFAVEPSPDWVRVTQVAFGVLLAGWAAHKTSSMLRRTA
ncbi:hypothetical protein [Nonomuraea dietziae]|uniref:hypothetical protein n=1 Tax=Nonomuraea dietziae TaxID=65515 RepID=UPI00343BEC3D